MENQQIVEIESHKHLGVILSADCTWHLHIKYVADKARPGTNQYNVNLTGNLLELYTLPSSDLFCDILVSSGITALNKKIHEIQNEAARIATGTTKRISLENLQDAV